MFFNKYPEKIETDRSPNVHILARCGIGDMYSFITRLSSLQKKYPDSRIYFYVGGWGQIPFLLADILDPYPNISGVTILEGYWRRSERRMKRMIRFIKSKSLKGDILENWILKENPLKYPMTVPFSPELFKEDHLFTDHFFKKHHLDNEKVIAIHPISTKGNAEAFEKDRFWESHKWQLMVNMLIESGYKILLIGAKGEDHGIEADDKKIFNFQGTTIRQTMAALIKVNGILCTSSWTWEVPAFHGLPVAVLWGVRYEHSSFLLPENKKLDNVFIERNMDSDPKDLCMKFMELLGQ